MSGAADGFSRWVAEHTSALVTQREADRHYVERKASASLAFLLAVASFAASEKGLLERQIPRYFVIASGMALLAALLLGIRVLFARSVATISPASYVRTVRDMAEGKEYDPFTHLAQHHELVAVALGKEVSRRGKWTFWMQVASLISALGFLAAVAFSRWCSAHP